MCSTRQKLLSNYSLALDLQSFYTRSERLTRDAQHQERITPVAAPARATPDELRAARQAQQRIHP
jgi:hypothetical protein